MGAPTRGALGARVGGVKGVGCKNKGRHSRAGGNLPMGGKYKGASPPRRRGSLGRQTPSGAAPENAKRRRNLRRVHLSECEEVIPKVVPSQILVLMAGKTRGRLT